MKCMKFHLFHFPFSIIFPYHKLSRRLEKALGTFPILLFFRLSMHQVWPKLWPRSKLKNGDVMRPRGLCNKQCAADLSRDELMRKNCGCHRPKSAVYSVSSQSGCEVPLFLGKSSTFIGGPLPNAPKSKLIYFCTGHGWFRVSLYHHVSPLLGISMWCGQKMVRCNYPTMATEDKIPPFLQILFSTPAS